MPAINWKEVRPYLKLEHFTPEIIAGKNAAAAGLCNWVINIVIYYDVVVDGRAEAQLVAERDEQLAEANTKLEVEPKVAELEAQLAKLDAELDAANATRPRPRRRSPRAEQARPRAAPHQRARVGERALGARHCRAQDAQELLIGDVLLASRSSRTSAPSPRSSATS